MCRIAQCFTNACDRIVEAVVEINKRIRLPELIPKFLSGYEIASGLNQDREYLERLALQAKSYPAFAQFTRMQI